MSFLFAWANKSGALVRSTGGCIPHTVWIGSVRRSRPETVASILTISRPAMWLLVRGLAAADGSGDVINSLTRRQVDDAASNLH